MLKINIVSWNVNGIRAIYKKGLTDTIKKIDAEIFCFQETKANENQLSFFIKQIDSYKAYFKSGEKAGYSGVATYSRIEPKKVNERTGVAVLDSEGRVLLTEYKDFLLFNIYFPNGKASVKRLAYKMKFYHDFSAYCRRLLAVGNKIIVCGDVNTAHREIDLARPKENEKVSGFLPEERAWIDQFLELGFLDAFRLFNKKAGQYTWWSMRSGARERNVGWRLDYFFVSENLRDNLLDCRLLPNIYGSDHCPISLSVKI